MCKTCTANDVIEKVTSFSPKNLDQITSKLLVKSKNSLKKLFRDLCYAKQRSLFSGIYVIQINLPRGSAFIALPKWCRVCWTRKLQVCFVFLNDWFNGF